MLIPSLARTPPMLPRLSSPPLTLSASVLPSTSPSSTTRSSTHQTALATLPSRPLTTPLPSSTLSPRSLTVTALLSCSFSVITSPFGPRPTAVSQSLLLRQPRPRRSPPRPPRRPLPLLRSPVHKRFSVHSLPFLRRSDSSQQRRRRVISHGFLNRARWHFKACSERRIACCGALRRGNELIPQNAFAT